MAATAALSAAAAGQVAAGKSGPFPALTVTLALTTGLLALAAGLARLGSSRTSSPSRCSRGSSWARR
jgi:MFS superfamily sulfate permease-like transporter